MKKNLLYLALVFIIPCFTFYGNESEAHWLWTDRIWVPSLLASIALICVALYFYKKKVRNYKNGN